MVTTLRGSESNASSRSRTHRKLSLCPFSLFAPENHLFLSEWRLLRSKSIQHEYVLRISAEASTSLIFLSIKHPLLTVLNYSSDVLLPSPGWINHNIQFCKLCMLITGFLQEKGEDAYEWQCSCLLHRTWISGRWDSRPWSCSWWSNRAQTM